MAAGVPAVAVKAPGPIDILARGGGLLVPAEEDAFVKAVLTLLNDEVLRKEMGQEALHLAQPYAISETTKKMLAVYEEAILALRSD
jgi:glycosyltransferase involved in cell wall biosynthesis